MSDSAGAASLRLYFSARSARQPEIQRYAAEARNAGLQVASRWVEDLAADAHTGERRRAAQQDLEDLRSSDVCVAFTDGPFSTDEAPTSSAGSGGRHVEFGYALCRGIRLLVVGPREHLFHELPAVAAAADWPTALDALKQWASEGATAAAAREASAAAESPG